MSSVYPRAAVEKVVVPVDPYVLAECIIAARENDPGASKAHLVGAILQGSDDVAGFERAWAAVERERLAMAALRPADYETFDDYDNALAAEAKHLSVTEWIAGVYAVADVDTFDELLTTKESASAEL